MGDTISIAPGPPMLSPRSRMCFGGDGTVAAAAGGWHGKRGARLADVEALYLGNGFGAGLWQGRGALRRPKSHMGGVVRYGFLMCVGGYDGH